jgi:hypothetical protein
MILLSLWIGVSAFKAVSIWRKRVARSQQHPA